MAFSAGAYRPGTEEGRRLIAHELTHTLQPADGGSARLSVGAVDDPAEHQAEAAANAIATGRRVPTPTAASARLARQAHDRPPQRNCPPAVDRMAREAVHEAAGDVDRAINALPSGSWRATDDAVKEVFNRYFHADDEETVQSVRTRLGYIRECVRDTEKNSRWICDPEFQGTGEAATPDRIGQPIVSPIKVNPTKLTFTPTRDPLYVEDRRRRRIQTVIHECGHLCGLGFGPGQDVYSQEKRFEQLSPDVAVQNPDSYAMFCLELPAAPRQGRRR
jgi:hypothetical protein